MNKYYTPEIEEFYVGFEYYTTTHPVSMEEFSPYVKGEFDHNTFEREFNIDTDSSGEIIKIGVPSCIKVKYLDREDIESFGWKAGVQGLAVDGYSGWEEFKKDDYRMVLSDNQGLIIVCRNHTSFSGTIKNKSELKKLLKQLGI